VAYSIHHLWSYLVLINSFYSDLFYSFNGALLRFFCISRVSLFFTFLSLLSLHKLQGGERRERKQTKKKTWRHTKTIVEKILTRRIQQYQRKSQTIRVIQRCQGSLAFMWPTPVTVSNLPWYYWICLVEVFSTVPVMLSSKFWYVLRFFLFPFLSPLSLLNLMSKIFAI
jgi:hypothetical protein